MKTNYKQIQEIRNEQLHNGKPPLEIGVEIKDNGQDSDCNCKIPSGVIASFSRHDERSQTYYKLDNGLEVCAEDLTCCGEILGLPVMLSDILMMLQSKHDVKLGGKNELVIKEFSDRDIITIDISKKISEQEPQVLEKLLEILK